VDASFSWDIYHGYTAFALLTRTDEEILALVKEALGHGWNTPRVCAETEFWGGDERYPRQPRDVDQLNHVLDLLARVPGVQVLLIGDCTLKGPVPELEKRAWAEQVARVAAQYKNVAIETHNEFDNCSGRGWGPHCPGKQDIRVHIDIYRHAGIQYITADDSLCYGKDEPKTYQFRLANIGASPADFHPCRWQEHRNEPWDPSVEFLRNVERHNGMFVLSETVAWMDYSGTCDRLRTCDQDRINAYIAACAAVSGCKFTFHSEALLAGEPPTFWPEAR
jgi:hypothetical protein